MSINNVLAGISVKDFTSAVAWYERLLNRPTDSLPMEGLAEWQFAQGGRLQVFQDKDRGGSSSVTLVVTSLDDQLAKLQTEGISVGPTQTNPGLRKIAMVTDSEGNRITFVEDLTADK